MRQHIGPRRPYVDAGEKEVVTSQRDEDACATRVYRKRRSPAGSVAKF
jgi:hypothetical protein